MQRIELKQRGVDVVDCSSGGFDGAAFNALSDYHVPYAERIAREAGVCTMAAGLISSAQHAESIVAEGKAALVGLAREALFDPNWPLHAAMVSRDGQAGPAIDWPPQAGWALRGHAGILTPQKELQRTPAGPRTT